MPSINKTISGLDNTNPLDGSEYIPVVQSGITKKTTIDNIISGNAHASVTIGRYSETGPYSVAVGIGARAYDWSSTALGPDAFANGYAVAVGYSSHSSGFGAITIGSYSKARGDFSVSIGYKTNRNRTAANSIALGRYAEANTSSIAIGRGSYAEHRSVSIGEYSYSGNSYGIAIGFRAYQSSENGIALGSYSSNHGYDSVSIGNNSHTTNEQAISIGYQSHSGLLAVAIGCNSYSSFIGTAIGSNSQSSGDYSVSLGNDTGARRYSSIAIGNSAQSNYESSTVIGQNTSDFTMGSIVLGGHRSSDISPTTHEQRFIGRTKPISNATCVWEENDFRLFITYPGVAGNSFSVFITDSTGTPDVVYSMTFISNVLSIVLGTDGSGNLTTTMGNVMDSLGGFGFGNGYNSGGPSTVLHVSSSPGTLNLPLSGGSDAIFDCIMTVDGNTPDAEGSHNLPNISENSIGRLTGTVIGYDRLIATQGIGAGEMAVFSLTPNVASRKNNGDFSLLNEPIFVLETSSVGATSWAVPTIELFNKEVLIHVYGTTDLLWVAFLKFEATY